MKTLLLGLLLIGHLTLSTGSAHAVQVCQVHNGDTLTMCQGNKIRLAGIDAPEIKQRYGSQARNTLNNMVIGQNIALQCDGKSYDRKVCTVFRDTRNINQVMVQQGFAYDYQQYSHGAYLPAQQYAQTHHLGVW